MTIEKLPSGSYRIRQMYQGKYYSVTLPYKPNKADASRIINEKISRPVTGLNEPLFMVCETYISHKENVLSPRTVREYKLYINRIPSWLMNMPVNKITGQDVQRMVNELSLNKSPKTVRSLHGFISAVLGVYRTDLKLSTTLPQRVKNEPYIPDKSDVRKILDYTRENNPMFYVPIALASLCGLRRSEILALSVDDIKDGEIYIHSAKVENSEGKWVVKTTKTEDSTRYVPIPKDLEDYIKKQGYVYNGGAQSISNFLSRTEDVLNIPHFSIHKLRHFYASELLTRFPVKDVQALGGWSSDATLRNIYAHSMRTRTKDDRQKIASFLWESVDNPWIN